jgi:hypothetical protein
MTFPSQKARVPAGIGTLVLSITTQPDGTATYYLSVQLLDAQGGVINSNAAMNLDLAPYLGAAAKTALDNFMTNLRTRVNNEMLA